VYVVSFYIARRYAVLVALSQVSILLKLTRRIAWSICKTILSWQLTLQLVSLADHGHAVDNRTILSE